MHVSGRKFPYPVLNKNQELSGYTETSEFSLKFDSNEDGSPVRTDDELIFSNLCYILKNSYLQRLIDKGVVKSTFLVECPVTMYRRKFDISDSPYDLHIPLDSLSDSVTFSCYLYADTDIHGFHNKKFNPSFRGYSFDIDRFDILAVDDGYTFKIDRNPVDDNRVTSIFQIVMVDNNTNVIRHNNNDKNIEVFVPRHYYDDYSNIKSEKQCNNISFSNLAVTPLSESLHDILDNEENYATFDDILSEHEWFSAIMNSYQKQTGHPLTMDEFQNTPAGEMAQTVLGGPLCNGLDEINDIMFNLNNYNNGDIDYE